MNWSVLNNLKNYNHNRPLESFQKELKIIKENGFYPIAVTQMYFEDVYVFETSEEAKSAYEYLEEEFLNKVSGYNFREILEEYCQLIDNNENSNRQEQLVRLEPTIKDIVNKLSTSRIRSLSYSKSAINKELYQSSTEVTEAVKETLIDLFESNKFKEGYQNIIIWRTIFLE